MPVAKKENENPELNAAMEQINKMLETAKKTVNDMINEAKEEADKIISDARQTAVSAKPRKSKKEPTVYVKIPLDKEHTDDFTVSLNGKTYLIQRGVPVCVPESVNEIIENSTRQEERALIYSMGLANQFEAKINQLTK